MKLASLTRRSYRRPAQQQHSHGDFFAGDAEPATFFGSDLEARRASDASFFQTDGPGQNIRAKADEEPGLIAKEPEEPMESKLPEEEEPAAKAPEEEEPVASKEDAMEEEREGMVAKCSCGCAGSCHASAAGAEDNGAANAARAKAGEAASSAGQHSAEAGTPGQRASIAASIDGAKSLARQAVECSNSVLQQEGSPTRVEARRAQFQRWFGAYDPRRVLWVRETFRSIARELGGPIPVGVDSRRRVYAYVLRNGQKKIYLGGLFWKRAGSAGYNSRPGVLIHELAHLVRSAVADQEYGTRESEELAKRTPERAVQNADSYEYFAETAR